MNPPRNSQGSAPAGVTRCNDNAMKTSATRPAVPTTSSRRPFVRSGPRITADGRQSIANAAPMSRPLPA